MTKKSEPSLKTRLAAQLIDLRDGGRKDPEVARIAGGLAAAISDSLKSKDWTTAKKAMDDKYREALFKDFHTNAEARKTMGDGRYVYAIQLLGLSIAAASDPELAEGEALLDSYVLAAERTYREFMVAHKEAQAATKPNVLRPKA